MMRSPPSYTRFSYHGAFAYTSGSTSPRICTREVNSFTNGVISGWKKTVGGTVVAALRGLNAVELIQYSGIR